MIWWQRVYKDWRWSSDNDTLNAFLDDLFTAKKFEFWELDRSIIFELLNSRKPENYASLNKVIYKHHASKAGKPNAIIGDKNNFHLNHIRDLDQLFPDTKFVHIIRDGRDVATSYMDMGKIESQSDYRPSLPSEISDIAEEWSRNINAVRESFAALPAHRTLEIRYEDLVLDTESTLTAVCEFLEQSYEPDMLEFYLKNQETKLEPDEFMAWKARTRGKVDSSAIGKWQNLPDEDIARFENICGNILQNYNYLLSSETGVKAC